jgi:hypothetical protein
VGSWPIFAEVGGFFSELLSNLKTSFSGTFLALKFDKYADRYLGAFNYRFNSATTWQQ